jgi:DNA-binding NarL/FixJ family response regulator
MIRVLIAAADCSLRSALKLMLCQRLPVTTVNECAGRDELAAGLAQLQPDLLLVDWALPEFRNTDRLAVYQSLAPHAHLVVLSVAADEIAPVLAAGADACLARGASPETLLGILRPMLAGMV